MGYTLGVDLGTTYTAAAIRRGDRIGKAENQQRHRLRYPDEVDRRLQGRCERSLAAAQQPGDVRAAVGDQVLRGIPGDLATELTEPALNKKSIRLTQPREPGHEIGRPRT